MLPLISLTTQFLLIALVVTAIALGATVAFLFVRARRAEIDDRLSEADRDELRQRDTEIAAIRQRIEEIYERQQGSSETQLAVVHQRLASLQHHLKARTRQIEGLQSQLQYEMQQREAEMSELRSQLQEAVQAFRGQALPAAEPKAIAVDSSVPAPKSAPAPFPAEELLQFNADLAPEYDLEADTSVQPVDEPSPGPDPTLEMDAAPEPVETDNSSDDFAWSPVELDFTVGSPEEDFEEHEEQEPELTPAGSSTDPFSHVEIRRPEPVADESPEAEPELDGLDNLLHFLPQEDDPVDVAENAVPDDLSETGEEEVTVSAPVAEDDLPEPNERSKDAFGDLIQWTTLDAFPLDDEPEFTAVGTEAPNGRHHPHADTIGGDGIPEMITAQPVTKRTNGRIDDLTILPMIDQRRQQQINALGVHSIEEIARWSRADARRVVQSVPGVTEEEIMKQWIFAAQSILFDRYQAELRHRGDES